MELSQVVWFWVLVIVTLIVIFVFIIFFIVYCHQSEKTTVVRFTSPSSGQTISNPSFDTLGKQTLKAIVVDNRELIKPKIKFYERSRESTPCYEAIDSRSLASAVGRRGSSRPLSSVSSISEEKRERRISLIGSTFDATPKFFKEESRESTPIRPLDPAYESQGPLHISNSSFVPPFLLRQNEIALPPGYVSFNDTAKF